MSNDVEQRFAAGCRSVAQNAFDHILPISNTRNVRKFKTILKGPIRYHRRGHIICRCRHTSIGPHQS